MEWKPIETAPKERYHYVDIWLVNKKTGTGRRVPNAHYSNGWEDSATGRWVSGKRFYDQEGDTCYDPMAEDEESTVATHWMPPPDPPTE